MNIESAIHAVEFCHISERDGDGKPSTIIVPGHELKRYTVTICRQPNSVMHCGCKDEEGKGCPGNTYGKVCYHVLAALKRAVEGVGHLEFFPTEVTPNVMVEMGRRKLKITSENGPGVLWAVFWAYRKKKRAIKVQKPPEGQKELFVVPHQGSGPYDPEVRA